MPQTVVNRDGENFFLPDDYDCRLSLKIGPIIDYDCRLLKKNRPDNRLRLSIAQKIGFMNDYDYPIADCQKNLLLKLLPTYIAVIMRLLIETADDFFR